MAIHEHKIPTELRGYAKHEVDRLLRNLDATIEQLTQDRETLSAQLESLKGDFAATKNALEKLQQNKPNFAGLGSKFEEVLRVAETQAEKMLTEAKAEAELITNETNTAVKRRLHESEEQATRLVEEAEARAKEIRLSAESSAAEQTARASQRLAESVEKLTAAKREAAKIRSDAEQDVVQLKLDTQEQLDQQRRELHRLREETEHRVLAADHEIAAKLEEAEIKHAQIHDEATLSAQALLEQANAKAVEINRRAQEVAQESEMLHARVQAFVAEREDTSRKLATDLIDSAQRHADEITRDIEEFSDHILARALTKLEQQRTEIDYVQEFVTRHRTSRKTSSVISELEAQLRSS